MDFPTKLTAEQIDSVLTVYWMMLRDLESRAGDSPNVLDAHLVKSAYAVWNDATKSNLKPQFIK